MSERDFEPTNSAHPSMCPCCSGQLSSRFYADSDRAKDPGGDTKESTRKNDIAQNAGDQDAVRQNLVNDFLASNDNAANRSRENFADRNDITVEESNGKYKYSYQADGKRHELIETDASPNGLATAQKQLDSLSKEKIESLESRFKVKFTAAGQPTGEEQRFNDDCSPATGKMLYSKTPSLRQLHAIDLALQNSQPSQLMKNSNEGVNITFVDGRPMAQVYGGRWPLGYHRGAEDGKRAELVITQDGAKLAATDKDAEPNARNLKWTVSHEIIHNSQQNAWGKRFVLPKPVLEQLGWTAQHIEKDGKVLLQWEYALHGKNGEFFSHMRSDCKSPSVWYLAKEDTTPLNADGQVVEKIHQAKTFTNEEVMDRANVRPNTYYFGNALEMHAEGLTGFRYSRDSRLKLLKESPQLYDTVKKYDQEELGRVYGNDSAGKANMVRMPNGEIVTRSNMAERAIRHFESGTFQQR